MFTRQDLAIDKIGFCREIKVNVPNVDNLISFQKQNISTCISGAFKDEYDSLIYIK